MDLRGLLRDAGRFGWRACLYDRLYRLLGARLGYRCFAVVLLRPAEVPAVPPPAGYRGGFLPADRLLAEAHEHPDLDARFVREATAAGDRCYGLLYGEEVASYGWYAHRPTPVEPGLQILFPDAWVYMYKGYTHPRHRGRRLHGVGMLAAAHALRRLGFEGLVSIVEANNAASLRSCRRIGYRLLGRVRALRLAGRWWVCNSGACRRAGVSLVAAPAQRGSSTNSPRSMSDTTTVPDENAA